MNHFAKQEHQNNVPQSAKLVLQPARPGQHATALHDSRSETLAQRKLQETADNSPRSTQLKKMIAMAGKDVHTGAKMPSQTTARTSQLRRYFPGEVQPPVVADVRYGEITVQGIKATKRMQATNLNYKNIAGGGPRTEYADHSDLYKAMNGFYNTAHDMHMLHASLGGKGKPPNLVPGTSEANNNMMDFEQAVISMVTLSSNEFYVVDYEVAANYGRAGDDLRAALPTSIDMRVTEKESDDAGATWTDSSNTFARNVSITAPTFGAPDDAAMPVDEQTAMGSQAIGERSWYARKYNEKFADKQWTEDKISRTADPSKVLRYFRNYGLITNNYKDSHYVWNASQLATFIDLKFQTYLIQARNKLDKLTIPWEVKNQLRNGLIVDWQKQIALSAEKSSGAGGVPQASFEDAEFWLERLLEGLDETWFDVQEEYAEQVRQKVEARQLVENAENALRLARLTKWRSAANDPEMAMRCTIRAHETISSLRAALPYYEELAMERAEKSLGFLAMCTRDARATSENTEFIPNYLNQISVALGI